MKYFLITFDRRRHRILDRVDFSLERRDEALEQRAALVRQYRDRPELEIVLLGADSFDDLKKTHGRYFRTVDQLAKRKKSSRRDTALTG